MYRELTLIKELPDRATRVKLALLFIEEYGGWATHIENTGLSWGVANEETSAGRELTKCRGHLIDLRKFVENECANLTDH